MTDVLLVEDEESVNRGIEFTLTKEGYQVETAGTICKAEIILEEDHPQMVICDLNLPDGSGLDLIRRIREKSMAHIICLTALDTEMDQVMGYEAGADDYVTQQTEAVSVIESGGMLFNLAEMTARKDGQDISFTKNEWKMLKMFLENPRQILSRNQILERLFDTEGDFVDENTVAVNIRRLRAKIEKDSSQPKFIRNVRGLGYIWDCDCRKGETGPV